MKFDVFSWQEVKTNEALPVQKGTLQLRLSAACPVYVQAQGVEALAGTKTEFSLDFSEPVTVLVQAPKGVRAFINVPVQTFCEPDGEVYTNIDRLPHESGMLAEVTRARRQLELERRSMIRDIRAEAAKARASLRPKDDAELIEPADTLGADQLDKDAGADA